MAKSTRILFLASLVTVLLSGCIGGSSPPSQFYMLEPIKRSAGVLAGNSNSHNIAIAPVRIPQYLDRPQFVVAKDRNSYELSEFNRWAERLDDNISRVLAQNLSLLIPSDKVVMDATGNNPPDTLRIQVNILEFHVQAEGLAILITQWSISQGSTVLLRQQGNYQETATGSDYRIKAQALNLCLDRFSRDLAESLRPWLDR